MTLLTDLSLHGCVAPPHRGRRGLRGLEDVRSGSCLLLQDGDESDVGGIKHSSNADAIGNHDIV